METGRIERARVGARKVLTESLGLTQGDSLIILCDEQTEAPARIVLQEAEAASLHASLRLIPVATQVAYSREQVALAELGLREELADRRGVLTCFADLAEATRFRLDVVRLGTDRGRRLGHIPGLTVELLSQLGGVDHRAMVKVAEDLALAMALGDGAELETYVFNRHGDRVATHTLSCRLGGMERPPIISTGIIPLDTWGNIPGGETFIAPIEGTAAGTFVLNGSFRGHVLSPDEPLLLTFLDGQLSSIDGPALPRKRLAGLLCLPPGANGGQELQLAELGIGLNQSIEGLTGHSLLDEKCAGTAHIAVGDNSRYGGHLRAPIHEDLVTLRPSLTIDAKAILDGGSIVFRESEWRESLEWDGEATPFQDKDALLSRSPTLTYVDSNGRLCVRREVAAGRMCIYSIGTDSSSRALASVLSLVPPFPNTAKASDIVSRAQQELSIPWQDVLAGLSILARHRVLHVTFRGPHG